MRQTPTKYRSSQKYSLSNIENLFLKFNDPISNSDFFQFVTELLEKTPWIDLPDGFGFYKEACLGLAFDINAYNQKMGSNEPQYHNRQHFQDVCTSLSLLLNQKVALGHDLVFWDLKPEDFWILLLSSIAHDYGHDGSINSFPHQLEKQSVEKINIFLNSKKNNDIDIRNLISKIEPIILATDPSSLGELLNKFSRNQISPSKTDCLSMLMVEADLLASTLPRRGLLLGKQLAEEWRIANPKAALTVASPQGRINFLEHIRFVSPYAITLGMEEIRQESINQLKASL